MQTCELVWYVRWIEFETLLFGVFERILSTILCRWYIEKKRTISNFIGILLRGMQTNTTSKRRQTLDYYENNPEKKLYRLNQFLNSSYTRKCWLTRAKNNNNTECLVCDRKIKWYSTHNRVEKYTLEMKIKLCRHWCCWLGIIHNNNDNSLFETSHQLLNKQNLCFPNFLRWQ